MAKQEAAGLWGTESSLPEHIKFDVKSAWFGPNEESDFDPDKLHLWLEGDQTDLDSGTEEEDATLRYGIGSGWEVVEEGAEVEHESGRAGKMFNESSGIGKVIAAMVKCDGAMDLLADRPDPRVAANWVGLTFEMQRVVGWKFTPEGEDEERTINISVPVAVSETKAAKKGAKKGSKKAPAKKKKVDDLREAVVEFASDFSKHSDFVAAVQDEDQFARADEVEEDDDLLVEVLDKKSALWKEAQA